MVTTAAESVAGLRQDLTEACETRTPCSAVTALLVNACVGGEILSYDLGLRGVHYLNRLVSPGGAVYVVDLTRDRVFADWIAPSEGTVCPREELVKNDDTFHEFCVFSERLLEVWRVTSAR